MPDNRFFVETPFSLDHPLSVKEKEFHHLQRVMRKKVGDEIEVVNGLGDFAEAKIVRLGKESAELSIVSLERKDPPGKSFRLVQALPHMALLELIVEKCIELGCTEFWLFFGARSEKFFLSDSKKERLHYIAISALKQCGSYYLPKFVWIENVEKCAPPGGPVFFGDLRAGASKIGVSEPSSTFINGPEGGLTEKETAFFETQWNAKGVSLHHNTLRTETAAIVATAFYTL